jgi:hypothetical protein
MSIDFFEIKQLLGSTSARREAFCFGTAEASSNTLGFIHEHDSDASGWRAGRDRSRITSVLPDAVQTMLASEAVLRQEWDTPEEDEAWADL